MAFANYNERPWNVTNIELLDYVDKFKNLKSNKTHMFKRWLNGSRFVLLWGNNKTINFTSDWSLKSNKSEDPSREIEACIDIKNNTLTIFDVNILEQGAWQSFFWVHYSIASLGNKDFV
jgi:hypothetical protein